MQNASMAIYAKENIFTNLIGYRPAMPLGNRKKYFRGSFQVSIVKIQKYHPLET